MRGMRSPASARIAAVLFGALLLNGCALPRSAATIGEMRSPDTSGGADLVDVTAADVPPEPDQPPAGFSAALQGLAPVDVERLGTGDVIAVTVWERDTLGLFPAGPGGASDLGELTLDRLGMISLPYAGSIRASGLTPAELRVAIERKLRRLILMPQVAVRVIQRHSLAVTVQGDVAKPGTVAIGLGVERLSGLLGLVAPNQQNPEQLAVTLRRGGVAATVRLSDIYRSPEQDIALRGGDSIVVHAIVEQLTVLGATGVQGQVPILRRGFSVIDALGSARGLNGASADPRAVFLMRRVVSASGAAERRTIYHFDLRRPDQLFLAGRFATRNGDILLISDAPFTKAQKLLAAFSAVTSAVRPVTDIAP